MKEAGLSVPSLKSPENTSERDSAYDDETDSDFTDSDDEYPVEGANLLEQICNLQNAENANQLGLSAKPAKSKPLAV